MENPSTVFIDVWVVTYHYEIGYDGVEGESSDDEEGYGDLHGGSWNGLDGDRDYRRDDVSCLHRLIFDVCTLHMVFKPVGYF